MIVIEGAMTKQVLVEWETTDGPHRSRAGVVISVRRDHDATVISATGSVDVALLADLANAARLVSIDGPVILDLSQVDLLDDASAALVEYWSKTAIHGGAVSVTTIRVPDMSSAPWDGSPPDSSEPSDCQLHATT